jgi:hypothetical protein
MTMVEHLFASCWSSAVRSAKRVGEPSGSTYCLGAHMMGIETAGMMGGHKALERALVLGQHNLRAEISDDQGTSAAGLVALAGRAREYARALYDVAGQ